MKSKAFLLKRQEAGDYFGYRLPWLPKKIAKLKGWDDSNILEFVAVKGGVLIQEKKK